MIGRIRDLERELVCSTCGRPALDAERHGTRDAKGVEIPDPERDRGHRPFTYLDLNERTITGTRAMTFPSRPK